MIAGLAVVGAISERGRVRVRERHEESISLLPTLFAAVVGGPLAGFAVGAATFGLECRRPFSRWVAYTSTRALSGGVAGLVATAAMGRVGASSTGVLAATACAGLAIQLLDAAFVALTATVRRAFDDIRMLLIARAWIALAALPLSIPVVLMLAIAEREVSVWTVPLFCAPALVAHRLFVMYQTKAGLAASLAEANRSLEDASLGFATALVATLDARDRYTAGHSGAVASHTEAIARQLGLAADVCAFAKNCALVHDIGKIGMPSSILEKPGPLTPAERAQLEEHPFIGARILERAEPFSAMASVVLRHHERYDGQGYPGGIAGDEIPLISRIIAVADAYDAMVSDRPYRKALSHTTAVGRLVNSAGTQFDASVVAAFLASCSSSDVDEQGDAQYEMDRNSPRVFAEVA